MRGTADRDARLISLLRLNGKASVEEIARALSVGTATVRRDLRRLSDEGRVVRTYGGASLASPRMSSPGVTEAVAEKRRIAEAAAALVVDGQTIVISSGTTTNEFARRLVGRKLTVITNSLDIAQVLLDQDGIELIVLGGAARPRMHSLLGHLTDLAAHELRADALFMGIPAVSLEHGMLSDHMPEILTDRALQRMVSRVVVLADASKFERLAPAFVFGLDAVDTIVTDDRIRPETCEALEARGVRVIVASREGPAAS